MLAFRVFVCAHSNAFVQVINNHHFCIATSLRVVFVYQQHCYRRRRHCFRRFGSIENQTDKMKNFKPQFINTIYPNAPENRGITRDD